MSHGWRESLSPEQRLLLGLARIELGPERDAEVRRVIESGLDWQELVALAVRHGIPNLVFHHLRALDLGASVPAPTWQQLERHHATARLCSMRQRWETTRILDAFSEGGIEVMALKGIVLRETLYPDPGMRASGDVDIMIRRPEWRRAAACLESIGYRVAAGADIGDSYTPDDFHHMAPYESPNGGVMVEVHWHLVPCVLHVDARELWQRAAELHLEGRTLWRLSGEDQFLHLCVHAAQTAFNTGLRHLIDVAELERTGVFDEDVIVSRSARWGIQRHVATTVRLVDELIGGSQLCRSIADRTQAPAGVVAALREAVLDTGRRKRADRGSGMAQAVTMLRGRRWSELLGKLFPNRRYMERAYRLAPGSMLALPLYVLRPFLLAARYGLAFPSAPARRRYRLRMWLRSEAGAKGEE